MSTCNQPVGPANTRISTGYCICPKISLVTGSGSCSGCVVSIGSARSGTFSYLKNVHFCRKKQRTAWVTECRSLHFGTIWSSRVLFYCSSHSYSATFIDVLIKCPLPVASHSEIMMTHNFVLCHFTCSDRSFLWVIFWIKGHLTHEPRAMTL